LRTPDQNVMCDFPVSNLPVYCRFSRAADHRRAWKPILQKPRFSRELIKGAQLCIVDAASLPHRRDYRLPHAARHSPRFGSPVRRLLRGHPPSSIVARRAHPAIPERGIQSDSEPNTFQILAIFPDFGTRVFRPSEPPGLSPGGGRRSAIHYWPARWEKRSISRWRWDQDERGP